MPVELIYHHPLCSRFEKRSASLSLSYLLFFVFSLFCLKALGFLKAFLDISRIRVSTLRRQGVRVW